MFKVLFLATIIGLAIFTPQVDAAFDCVKVNPRKEDGERSSALFNLCPFERHKIYFVKKDFNYNGEGTNAQFHVNFTFPLPNMKDCENKENVYGTYNISDKNECKNLLKEKPKYRLINDNNETAGIIVDFAKSEKNPKHVVISIYCDKTIKLEAETVFTLDSIDDNGLEISGRSPYGCPAVSSKEIETILESRKWVFGPCFLLMGLFLNFLGLKLFKYAVFLIVFLITTAALGVTLFLFITYETPRWVLWVVLGFSVVVGLAAGYLALRYKKFGFLGVGIGLGVIGGLFFCSAVLNSVLKDREWLLWVIVAVFALIGGLLIFFLRKNITIIATSVIGSYLTVRALTIFGKHYPNEFDLVRGTGHFGWIGYLWLALMVVMAGLGIFVQHWHKRRRELKEKEIMEIAYTPAPEAAKV